MKYSDFLTNLQTVADTARHHPEPGLAVSLLAQLIQDMAVTLQPHLEKFGVLLNQAGLLDGLDKAAVQAQIDLKNSASAIVATTATESLANPVPESLANPEHAPVATSPDPLAKQATDSVFG